LLHPFVEPTVTEPPEFDKLAVLLLVVVVLKGINDGVVAEKDVLAKEAGDDGVVNCTPAGDEEVATVAPPRAVQAEVCGTP
jgi:hypothetical protein